MQILNFIIGACSFLLLVFSLHLFYAKQGNRMLNRLLSISVFTRFIQIVVYLLIASGQLSLFPFLQKIFTPFHYAAPACFYLYITGFINDRTHLKRLEWLHFIPVVLAIIHVLPWPFSPPIHWEEVARQILENKQLFITQRTGLFPPYFYYLWPALLLGYLFAAWRAVLSSRIVRAQEWTLNKIWIFFCLSTSTLFKVVSILPLIFRNVHHAYVSYPWYMTLNCIILVSVLVFILHQPRLLYGHLLVDGDGDWKTTTPNQKDPVQLEIETSSPKNNLLADELLTVYTASMNEFMENEKPFLYSGFQIAHLAQKLNIPVHHCSYVINNVIGKNFRDWINAYRIRDFIIEYPLLADKMTIEAIAYKSGFKSVATFYNAFKKETGLMPKAFFSRKEKELL